MSQPAQITVGLILLIFLLWELGYQGAMVEARDWCYRPQDLYYTTSGVQP